MFSTATTRLVRAHPEFCKSQVKHIDFCCFRGVTYVVLTLCFKLCSCLHLLTLSFALIDFSTYNRAALQCSL